MAKLVLMLREQRRAAATQGTSRPTRMGKHQRAEASAERRRTGTKTTKENKIATTKANDANNNNNSNNNNNNNKKNDHD